MSSAVSLSPDDIAPFVVINDKDAVPAWSFTLLHELVHLLLGRTGISGSSHPGLGIEAFCNNAAAEWMLPTQTLDQIEIDQGQHRYVRSPRHSSLARSSSRALA